LVYQNTLITLVLRIKLTLRSLTLMFNRLLSRELLRRLMVRNTIRLQELLDFWLTRDLEERESKLLKRLKLLREINLFWLLIESLLMTKRPKTNSNIEIIIFLILKEKIEILL
jgi:hypothetical protein